MASVIVTLGECGTCPVQSTQKAAPKVRTCAPASLGRGRPTPQRVGRRRGTPTT